MGVLDEIAPFDDPDDFDPHGETISREDRALMREWAREAKEPGPFDGVPLKRIGKPGPAR